MAEPILSIRNLGMNFGGLKAVSGLDLDIHEGELIGLIGPNGAGKTTVFNMLTGILKPSEGEILFMGKKLNGRKPHQIVADGMARTFQNIRLFKQMTVIENVLTAFTKDIAYGIGSTIFRTGKFFKS